MSDAAGYRDVIVPDIGEGLSEAEIVEWLVAEGDEVREDQPVVLISTEKASVELPAPVHGIAREMTALAPGTRVPVGTRLMRIETVGEPAREKRDAVLAAPRTRRLASELGIALESIVGSGPEGRILDDDVRAAADGYPAEHSEPLSPMRRRIADVTAASWREIPHITEFREVDASTLVQVRERLRGNFESQGIHLTYLPLLVKALASALTRHPRFNATLDLRRDRIVFNDSLNIGIAVGTEDGLLVPVLRDVERLTLAKIARGIGELADGARKGTLSPAMAGGGTCTVSNFGSYGTWLGTPIIRAPEVTIVGFGRIRDAVVAVNGAPAVRPMLPIAVATDHRLNDGSHLAAFVDELERCCRETEE
ncbi:2-oxo acid dehydrogenase subunit E2 [bacterium]|nr:MAG: 2-oxo acid dehydrogenase subunit E2 [bacterium]